MRENCVTFAVVAPGTTAFATKRMYEKDVMLKTLVKMLHVGGGLGGGGLGGGGLGDGGGGGLGDEGGGGLSDAGSGGLGDGGGGDGEYAATPGGGIVGGGGGGGKGGSGGATGAAGGVYWQISATPHTRRHGGTHKNALLLQWGEYWYRCTAGQEQ